MQKNNESALNHISMKNEEYTYIVRLLCEMYNGFSGEKNGEMLKNLITYVSNEIGSDCDGILLGKKDNFIRQEAYRYMINYSKSIIILYNKKYVYNYLKDNLDKFSILDKLTEVEKKKIIETVVLKIVRDNGEQYKLSTDDNDSLHLLIYDECRIIRSCKQKCKNDKPIKYGKKKKNVAKNIMAVLVAGALMVGGFKITSEIKKQKALSLIDPFSYSQVYTSSSKNFNETADHLFESYESFGNVYNHNFEFLAFYQVYNNIYGSNRLAIMDKYINFIKKNSCNKNDNLDINSDVLPYSSFVDYVYDLVVNSGNHKIDTDDYRKAVLEYDKFVNLLNTSQSLKNNKNDFTPYANLTDENQQLIEEIMKEYRNYCDMQINQLAKLVKRNEENNKHERN